jgi:hypothetical protein
MSTPEPAADEATSGRTFTGNLRRFVRRTPDMGDDPVDLAAATAICLFFTVSIGTVCAAFMWLSPFELSASTGLWMFMGVAVFHMEGPRHRWWALAATVAVSVATVRGVAAVLDEVVGRNWASLAAYLCTCWVGTHVYAAVTNAPRRRPDQ